MDYQLISNCHSEIVVTHLEDKQNNINALNHLRADYENSSSSSYTEVEDVSIETPFKSKKKKSKSSPSFWLRNVNTQRRASGKSYTDRSSKLVKRKEPKNIDCSKCRFKCSEIFSNLLRAEICSEYWGLEDPTRQKNYICSLITELPVKRRRPKTNNKENIESSLDEDDERDVNEINNNNQGNQSRWNK